MPGLEDLYREIILDHYRNPRNRGELPSPPAVRMEGFNPLCGDEIVVYLDVSHNVVQDLRIGGQGCSISQSSASMMSSAVKGKSVAQARATIRAFKALMSIHEHRLDGADEELFEGGDGAGEGPGGPVSPAEPVNLGDLEALQGVVKFPVRIKCATLSWITLAQGLDEAEAAAHAVKGADTPD
jgi:nitrogen fixation NifU-like protein